MDLHDDSSNKLAEIRKRRKDKRKKETTAELVPTNSVEAIATIIPSFLQQVVLEPPVVAEPPVVKEREPPIVIKQPVDKEREPPPTKQPVVKEREPPPIVIKQPVVTEANTIFKRPPPPANPPSKRSLFFF